MSRIRDRRTERPAPIPPGAVLLNRPRAVEPAAASRQFRILIEGVIAPSGQVGLSRLEVQGEKDAPVSPLEAESICRRIAFAPPVVPLQAMLEARGGPQPDEAPATHDGADDAPAGAAEGSGEAVAE